jgi:hypothetical protein
MIFVRDGDYPCMSVYPRAQELLIHPPIGPVEKLRLLGAGTIFTVQKGNSATGDHGQERQAENNR